MTTATVSEAPLFERVADRVQGLIDQGTLRAGERLPSVRKLHRQWGISISTVLEAYRVLDERGVLDVRPQSGHYVRARPQRLPEPRRETHGRRASAEERTDLMVRVTMRAGPAGLVRMGCGLPDPDLLPLAELDRTLGRVARRHPESQAYSVSPGHVRLRRALAGRMISAGCSLSADDLVITNGCQEALDLCLRTVARPGAAVVVEAPTYFGLLEILRGQGLRAVEVPSDARDGVDVDAVEEALRTREVAAVVLSVSFTNPLGALVPDARKQRLVELCTRHRVPLIEDDAYGELGFDGSRPRSLASWDSEGWVLSCGTLSKSLSPGLRVGWVAPGRFLGSVARLKMVSSLGCPTVPQLAAAEYLTTGGYDRHLRRLRRGYRDRVRALSAAVQEAFPAGTRLSRPLGGQFLWIEMPAPADAIEVFEGGLGRGDQRRAGAHVLPVGGLPEVPEAELLDARPRAGHRGDRHARRDRRAPGGRASRPDVTVAREA